MLFIAFRLVFFSSRWIQNDFHMRAGNNKWYIFSVEPIVFFSLFPLPASDRCPEFSCRFFLIYVYKMEGSLRE